jgi:copper chaperone CopZ
MLFRSKKQTFGVSGMSCGHCEAAVEKAVKDVAGVKKAKASHALNRVEVSFGDVLDAEAVRKAIVGAGYEVVETAG